MASKGASKPTTALAQKAAVPRYLGLPGSMRANLRYVEYVSQDLGAGVLGTYAYRCNSLFDPNYTGTGHQPLGFDQLAALYAHYTVLKSRIRVTWYPQSQGTVPAVYGICKSADYTLTGPWTTVAEQGPAMCTYTTSAETSAMSTKYPHCEMSYDAAKDFGVKDPVGMNTISAPVTGNPADAMYFVCWTQAIDGSADLAWTAIEVVIDFDCLFSEREQAPAS